MNLYPAIDLRGGMCVRLEKGNFSKETVYSKDPGAMARRFAEAGARTIHVVDLDGALAGKSENLSAIKAILREGGISIEVGGGIRTYEQIEGLLSLGVSQVILGSAAIYDPQLVERANRDFPHKIVVASMPKMAMQPLMDGKKTAISRPRHLLGVSPRRGRRESSLRTSAVMG